MARPIIPSEERDHRAMLALVLGVGLLSAGLLAVTMRRLRSPSPAVGTLPTPRLPAQMLGTWVQVYPAAGALDQVTFRADSTFSIKGSGAGLPFATDKPFSPTRWDINTGVIPGSLCVSEPPPKRTGLCQMMRVIGDTLRIGNEPGTTLLRIRDGAEPPPRAWAHAWLGEEALDNGGVFRVVRPVVIRADTAVPTR